MGLILGPIYSIQADGMSHLRCAGSTFSPAWWQLGIQVLESALGCRVHPYHLDQSPWLSHSTSQTPSFLH